MSIKYIKENLNKFDHDNLISFLFDIVIRGGLDDVDDFEENRVYHENEKIYFKDEKGNHHIYKCLVENSTMGMILQDEWIDLIKSFRKPIVTEETIVTQVSVKEEVVVATASNQVEFELVTPGVADGDFDIIVFHPDHGRLSKMDFSLVGKTIMLKEEYKVLNIGDKLIVDLYENN